MKLQMIKRFYILLFLVTFSFLFAVANEKKPLHLNIWQGTTVQQKVYMTPYLASGSNNVAVIVCPGGS